MAGVERSFISHVIAEGDIREAVDQMIQPTIFAERGEDRGVWSWMLDFYRDYGASPSEAALVKVFPDYNLGKPPEEPLLYLVEELRKKHVGNLLRQGIGDAAEFLKVKDPYEALAVWRKVLMEADNNARPSRDVSWTADPAARYAMYQERKKADGVTGLPTPWETLNELTQGMQPEDLWLIVARQNVGKTFIEVLMAHHLWAVGEQPLLLTKEMSVEQILRRFDAVHFGLPYMPLRAGRLATEMELEWEGKIPELAGSQDLWVSGDDSAGGVMGVAAKTERYKPAATFIDGTSFLDDGTGAQAQYERLSKITWGLKKHVARRFEIPVVASWQLSKRATKAKGNADDLANSDVARDADVIIGVFQDGDQREARQWRLELLKQREGPKGISFTCRADFDAMEFYELDREDEGTEPGQQEVIY